MPNSQVVQETSHNLLLHSIERLWDPEDSENIRKMFVALANYVESNLGDYSAAGTVRTAGDSIVERLPGPDLDKLLGALDADTVLDAWHRVEDSIILEVPGLSEKRDAAEEVATILVDLPAHVEIAHLLNIIVETLDHFGPDDVLDAMHKVRTELCGKDS